MKSILEEKEWVRQLIFLWCLFFALEKVKKLTTLGIPRRSPIQVLTEPDVA